MIPSEPLSPRLSTLLTALCDETIGEAEFAELQQLLTRDPVARRTYIRYLDEHVCLSRLVSQVSDTPDPTLAPVPLAIDLGPPADTSPVGSSVNSPLLGFLGSTWNWWNDQFISPRLLGAIIAVGLGTYFVALYTLIPLARQADSERIAQESAAGNSTDRSDLPVGIATLTSIGNTQWSPTQLPPAVPSQGDETSQRPESTAHIGQRYELLSGRVDVALARGTRVVIDGPAAWVLESEQRLRFDSGRLAARVPQSAIGFTVATPAAEVVDLGTEFGIAIDGTGQTEIHVLVGEVEVKPVPTGSPVAESPAKETPTKETQVAAAPANQPAKAGRVTKVVAGQGVRVTAAGAAPLSIAVDRDSFAGALRQAAADPVRPSDEKLTQIWLGNLFDDKPHVSLVEAMRTDTFGAEADFNDLGVSRVVYSGPALVEIAPDIKFDFATVGWQSGAAFKVTNDGMNFPIEGLRLTGNGDDVKLGKIEEGIGMHANTVLTFSLAEIRAAWKQQGHALQFVCDAVGINDGVINSKPRNGGIHLIVLVCSRTQPLLAIVDGAPAELGQHEGHAFVASTVGPPLVGVEHPFGVNQILVPEAEYLTLVCTSAGDGIDRDHAAWVGARLEVAR